MSEQSGKAVPEKVAVLGVRREPGHFYFVNGAGDVLRRPMTRGRVAPGSAAEVIHAGAFRREAGPWSYFVDSEGDVSRARLLPGTAARARTASRAAQTARTARPPAAPTKAARKPSPAPAPRPSAGAELLRIEVAGFVVTVQAPPQGVRRRP